MDDLFLPELSSKELEISHPIPSHPITTSSCKRPLWRRLRGREKGGGPRNSYRENASGAHLSQSYPCNVPKSP